MQLVDQPVQRDRAQNPGPDLKWPRPLRRCRGDARRRLLLADLEAVFVDQPRRLYGGRPRFFLVSVVAGEAKQLLDPFQGFTVFIHVLEGVAAAPRPGPLVLRARARARPAAMVRRILASVLAV